MHTEFFGGLALVASMTSQNFRDETLLELANRIGVRNAGGVHLVYEVI